MLPSRDADHDVVMQLAETLPGLVGIVGGDRRYRFLNSPHRDWFGIKPAAYIGRSTAEFAGALIAAEFGPALSRALAGESLTLDNTGPAGGKAPARLRRQLLPRRAESGCVLGCFVLTSDVTAEWRSAGKPPRGTGRGAFGQPQLVGAAFGGEP